MSTDVELRWIRSEGAADKLQWRVTQTDEDKDYDSWVSREWEDVPVVRK